jgi:galactitol-specific phosphotransferase system IIB component
MMRKLLFILLILTGFGIQTNAQTIVSTEPENRNVVLEEFTGIHCQYCPDGHRIAYELAEANPGDFFQIAIHQGGYASPNAGEPDFRTPWGNAIANQTDLQGYPAGTINRHLFPGMQQGNGTAMSRGDWGTAMNMVLNEISYVNIAAEATVDASTNELNIHVEAYYTGDSPEATNYINVALLESNVEGPQTGGSTYNPDFVLPNGNYSHQHMLRDLITGQWGEVISTTTEGSFIDLNYTYTVPGQYNQVPVNISNLDIVVFITETHQEIESGYQTIPQVVGLVNENDASVADVLAPEVVCGDEVAFSVIIKNNGNELLTSLEIDYSVNGGDVATYSWTGELASLESETVELPALTFSPLETNEVLTSVYLPNGEEDEDTSNNEGTTTFVPPVSTTQTINLEILTDDYASETTWELKDNMGTVLYSGGSNYSNNTLYNEVFEIDPGDCYAFEIYDSYGDGICCGYGNGYYTLTDSDDLEIFSGGDFGQSETTEFNSVTATGISAIDQGSALSIFPNPANDIVNIVSENKIENLTVSSLTGQILYSTVVNDSYTTINTSGFDAGVYFIKIETKGSVSTKRLVIK